jgi:hypothetical protein
VEEKKQTSRILCVQDKAKITTGPSTSTHWRSTDAQNTVSEAHDSAFRALASLSLRVLARQSLSVCVCVLESYGIMSSFMIPAMKQPDFQIVSKKAKINRAQTGAQMETQQRSRFHTQSKVLKLKSPKNSEISPNFNCIFINHQVILQLPGFERPYVLCTCFYLTKVSGTNLTNSTPTFTSA